MLRKPCEARREQELVAVVSAFLTVGFGLDNHPIPTKQSETRREF